MNDLEKLRKKALRLADSPGVYIMKNSKNEVIYVGKAKVLRNRVVSYFRNISSQNEKVRKMVENVEDFDFILTDSEFEALVLECSLIKQYSPKYNILLKDDRGYHYIKISNGKFPKITLAMRKADDGARYIGPYISSFAVKQAVEEVNRVFMMPSCSKNFDSGRSSRRPCLNYYINRCMGVCCGNVSCSEYSEIVEQAVEYLKSGSSSSLEKMKEQMDKAAAELNFEKAIKIRNRIHAIEKVNQSQKIYLKDDADMDVIAHAIAEDVICFVVLKFRNGHIVDKDSYIFDDVADFDCAVEDFIAGYYTNKNNDVVKLILISYEKLDFELYSSYIKKQTGKATKILMPKIGERKKILDMAFSNATEYLASKLKYQTKEMKAIQQLAQILNLKKPPARIEAYDISNLGDTGIVGGMVVFQNGLPLKKAYRKFKMKTVWLRNDYEAMREMISRRIGRYHEGLDESFKRLPDLILIDGGQGHVGAVREIFQEQNFPVAYFGMVKDSRHRTRAISSLGGEISITSFKNAFLLLTKIQDEVHRYTISYQKNVRKKTAFEIELTRVAGIGEKRALKILRHFKSKTELLNSDVTKISQIAGVSLEKAREILNFMENI